MQPEHETLWALLTDKNHWLLELIIMAIVDGAVGALLWPFVIRPRWRKWTRHHQSDDDRTKKLEDRVMKLEQTINAMTQRKQ